MSASASMQGASPWGHLGITKGMWRYFSDLREFKRKDREGINPKLLSTIYLLWKSKR